jgi:hypothetical protein
VVTTDIGNKPVVNKYLQRDKKVSKTIINKRYKDNLPSVGMVVMTEGCLLGTVVSI